LLGFSFLSAHPHSPVHCAGNSSDVSSDNASHDVGNDHNASGMLLATGEFPQPVMIDSYQCRIP
jgi:hypothetical protein